MITMTEWAENEIKLSKERSKKNSKEKDKTLDNYFDSCCDSALKAFKTLMEDGHSGASFEYSRMILDRLCKGIPLYPLTGENDEWSEGAVEQFGNGEEIKVFQNKRCSSVFKNIKKDGAEDVKDIDLINFLDINTNNTFSGGLPREILDILNEDELFDIHITFPYMPGVKKIIIEKEFMHYDDKIKSVIDTGSFNAVAYLNAKLIVRGELKKILPIRKYYKETKEYDPIRKINNTAMKEITEKEYMEMRKNCEDNKNNIKKEEK